LLSWLIGISILSIILPSAIYFKDLQIGEIPSILKKRYAAIPCSKDIPTYHKTIVKFKDKQVQFIFINIDPEIPLKKYFKNIENGTRFYSNDNHYSLTVLWLKKYQY